MDYSTGDARETSLAQNIDSDESRTLHLVRLELHQVHEEIRCLQRQTLRDQPLAERLALSLLEHQLGAIAEATRSDHPDAIGMIESKVSEGLKTIAQLRRSSVS